MPALLTDDLVRPRYRRRLHVWRLAFGFWPAIALCAILASCAEPPPPAEVDTSRYTKVENAHPQKRMPAELRYTEITQPAGIDFVHETGAFGEKWMPESMGSGCVLFDYDGDGELDLLLLNGTWWPGHAKAERATPHLYRNRGNGTFDDVTASAGLDRSIYATGGSAGDLDGDGDLDLYICAVGSNLLLRNDKGLFVDVTSKGGVAGETWIGAGGAAAGEWSTSAAWVDVDRDGWIDLFVCNYVRWSLETDLFTTLDGSTKSYATPEQYEGSTCRLYRNRGDGTFADVTRLSGVYNPKGKSLGLAVADFDGNGYPDLVISNDTQPNFLYRNRGDGTFEDVALAAGVAYDETGRARAGMGVDVAAMDGDGALTIAVGNFSRESVSLYRQAWGDVFVDVAGARGITRPTLFPLTFGVTFFDCDLDGLLDLALSNGHLEPGIQKVREDISYRQRPQLFWNSGVDGFEELSDLVGGPFEKPVVGRGLAHGDLDGDGDLDLVLTTAGGPPVVMRNDGPAGNAIRIDLIDRGTNRFALGAQASVTSGGKTQERTVRTGSSYMSQSELTLTFGLGDDVEGAVSVRWQDGSTETLGNLPAGARYRIGKGEGVSDRRPFRRSN